MFRGAVDYAKLARLMRLPEQQFVTLAQTVGYPRMNVCCEVTLTANNLDGSAIYQW